MVFVWGESLGRLTLEQREVGDRLPFLIAFLCFSVQTVCMHLFRD